MVPESLWDVSPIIERDDRRATPSDRREGRTRLGNQTRDPSLSRDALRDVHARRAFWLRELSYKRRRPRRQLAGVAIAATAIDLLAPLFVIGAVVLAATGRIIRSDRTRLLRSLRHGTCPNCGYLLAHEIPGGPEACSECGSPWPLIPSPRPGEGPGADMRPLLTGALEPNQNPDSRQIVYLGGG